MVRFCLPLAIVLLLALPAAFMMQKGNTFIYGSAGMHSPDSPIRQEAQRIKDKFSDEKLMLLLAPEGDRAKEARFSEALTQTPGITSVMSYANTVSTDIPPEVLPEKVTSNFYADGYARFIITTNLADEGPDTFQMIDRLRALSEEYYPRDSHLLGEAAVNFDLKNYITADSVKVLLAGILSIGLVLLINFKPVHRHPAGHHPGFHLAEHGWPYITARAQLCGLPDCVLRQLGATVDYGICCRSAI